MIFFFIFPKLSIEQVNKLMKELCFHPNHQTNVISIGNYMLLSVICMRKWLGNF